MKKPSALVCCWALSAALAASCAGPPQNPMAITGTFEQEEADGVVYVPSRTAVLEPSSGFASDETLVPEETSRQEFRVGLPKEGEGDPGAEFVLLDRHGDIAVGYLARRVLFARVESTVSHSLEGDKPVTVRWEYHIAYNNLVVELKGKRYVVDGGYLDRYFRNPTYRVFEPFGLEACEFGDFDGDGNPDFRVRYETIPSLSYFGLAGGPSYFYFTVISGALLPMFAFDEIGGEDIGLLTSTVTFRSPWWTARKDLIEQIVGESSESGFSANVKTYRRNTHYYLPGATKELFALKFPWRTKLVRETEAYGWAGSVDVEARLASGTEVEVVEGQMVLPSGPESSGFWFKVASPEGWVRGQDLSLPGW